MFLSFEQIAALALFSFTAGQVVGLFYAWFVDWRREQDRPAPGIHRRIGQAPPGPYWFDQPDPEKHKPAFLKRQGD